MADVDTTALRRVVEVALALVAAERPAPSTPGAALARLAARRRLDAGDLRRAARLLADDADLRRRVRDTVTVDMVGAEAYAWLDDPEVAVGVDRRRQAAEEARRRAETERDHARQQAERSQHALAEAEAALAERRRSEEQWRHQALDAQEQGRRLHAALESVRGELTRQQAAWEQARRQLHQQLVEVSAVRDALMAQRVDLEERLADLTSDVAGQQRERRAPRPTPPAQRTPLGIPGGLLSDSVAAARHVLDRSDVSVIVDGYNAVLDPWTDGHLSQRRAVLITALEGFVAHRGPNVLVVFDGAEAGAETGQRRFVRVVFSAPGTSADDVVCLEVERLPTNVPVVVATDDHDLVRRVRRLGATTVTVAQLWGVVRD